MAMLKRSTYRHHVVQLHLEKQVERVLLKRPPELVSVQQLSSD